MPSLYELDQLRLCLTGFSLESLKTIAYASVKVALPPPSTLIVIVVGILNHE